MSKISRRRLMLSFPGLRLPSAGASVEAATADARQVDAWAIRLAASRQQSAHLSMQYLSNGDESLIPYYAACFGKALPHAQNGEALPDSYDSLLRALSTGRSEDFAYIWQGSGRRLSNPQAGLAFCLEGVDPAAVTCPPAPSFQSPETAAEMVELYWQALTRDIPFSEYGTSPLAAQAGAELAKLAPFSGPRTSSGIGPGFIFRGGLPGCLEGPYVSQFLWKPVPLGSTRLVLLGHKRTF